MQTRLARFALIAAVLLVACHRKAPQPLVLGDVLPNFPLPPGGQALIREGGADAMQFVFVSPISPDSVASYYRAMLSTGVFHLVNEQTVGHLTALYAEQDGPSIWVTVAPNGKDGSMITIAGAADSTSRAAMKARLPAAPADTTNRTTLPPGKP